MRSCPLLLLIRPHHPQLLILSPSGRCRSTGQARRDVSCSIILLTQVLQCPCERRPVPYLLRSYGNKCFQEYPSNQHHTQWQKEFAARAAAKIPSSVAVPGNTVLPGGVERPVSSSGTGADSPGVGGPDAGSPITSTCYLRLQEHHYLPIMHSRRAKRIASSWCRAELQRYLVTEGFPLALPSSMDLAGEASCCTVSNSVMPILSSGTASPAV